MKTPLVICRVKLVCDFAECLGILDLFVIHLRGLRKLPPSYQKKKDFNIKRKKMIGDGKIVC